MDKKRQHPSGDHRQLIRSQAASLAELLCQSSEYHQFVAARQRLEADGDNAILLSELRQQQMAMRMAIMLGEADDEAEQEFADMFVSLSQTPVISDYLFAEGRFFRLMADVEEVFSRKLDLWQNQDDESSGPGYSLYLN